MEDSVSVLKFAECRAREISSLAEEIACKASKLTVQRLPYYMRRRAASHNPKRVPRKLREHCKAHLAKSTKKSKKHRDKPKSLLEEYNRRQSNFLWLETHLWHAKRFHMEKKWGYTLPICSTEKSFKASYKAAAKHTLLFDLSYYCCIELRGPEKQLLTKLTYLTDACTGKYVCLNIIKHLESVSY
ncbi:Ribonucleases P/MRP protein subunit POP1, partial [Stegodyphus mimosarum]